MGKNVEYDTTLALSSRPLRREAQMRFPLQNRMNWRSIGYLQPSGKKYTEAHLRAFSAPEVGPKNEPFSAIKADTNDIRDNLYCGGSSADVWLTWFCLASMVRRARTKVACLAGH